VPLLFDDATALMSGRERKPACETIEPFHRIMTPPLMYEERPTVTICSLSRVLLDHRHKPEPTRTFSDWLGVMRSNACP
jgi:hypothetical protein